MKFTFVPFIVVGAALLVGCAQTTAIPLLPGDATTPGVRIYDKKPLLMVYDTGAAIDFIPNYNRAYALQFTAFLAKNDVKTQYEMGTLKSLDTNLDSTDFIQLLSTIASGFLNGPGGGGPKLSSAPAGSGALRAVYDFEFDTYGDFVRLRRLDTGFPRPYPKPAAIPADAPGKSTDTSPKGKGGPDVGEES